MTFAREFAGFAPPRFDGASLLNLAATIDSALGSRSPYPMLAEPRLREPLLRARHLVLWVIDGLGSEALRTLVPEGALAGSVRAELTAVFPSSTAPTLTLFATGRAPAAHAVPEWFLWFDELGAIYRSLPLDARDAAGGRPRVTDASALYPCGSMAARSGRPCFAVLPADIADSAYSRYAHAGAQRLAFATEDSFIAAITGAMDASHGGSYVFAYVDAFDQCAHAFGVASLESTDVVRHLDRLFERLAAALARRGALLAVTADHGFIDVPADRRLRLDGLPEIAACLQRPLCGGPRTPFAYVKASMREGFADRVERTVGEHFAAVPSSELVAAGWFGPEAPNPRLAPRLGTHVLLPRSDAYLIDLLPGEMRHPLIGMHGGLASAEVRVPLILAGALPG